MKKLLSILVTLALMFSLSVPALAVEAEAETVPTWQIYGYASLADYLNEDYISEVEYYAWEAAPAEQVAWAETYKTQSPEAFAAFDLDTYFAEQYPEDTKATYMETVGLTTEAEFQANLLCLWVYEQSRAQDAIDQWAGTQASEPQRVAEFMKALPSYLAGTYAVDTIEAYMEQSYSINVEDAYMSLYTDWSWSSQYDQAQRAERDEKITALGGTSGQINVLFNDKCLALTPGQIKAIDGAVSLPADVLSKALGVTVKGDADGYAPVRAAAEAAGCQVFWDDEYQTVVLVDRKGVVDGLNAQFTQLQALIDGVLKTFQGEVTQAYATNERVTADVTLFNTLDGDSSYTLGCKLTTLHKDGNLSGTLTLDVAALLRQLSAEEKDALTGLLPGTLTLGQLITLAAGLEINFVWSAQESRLAFNIPVLATFADGLEKDTWVNLDLSSLADMEIGALTIGDLIYTLAAPSSYSYYYNGYLDYYTETVHQASLFTDLFGNARFTRQGGTLTYKLDTKTANAIASAFYQDDAYTTGIGDVFRNADFTVSLTDGGKLTASFHIRPNVNAIPGMGMLMSLVDFDYQGDITATPQKIQMTAQFHWKNQFKVKLTVTSATQETAKTPLALPDEEACIDAWLLQHLLFPVSDEPTATSDFALTTLG